MAFAWVAAAAWCAHANVLDLDLRLTTRSVPDDPAIDRPNTFTYDLFIDFTGPLGGQQLLMELDTGAVVNHPLGSDTPPIEALFEGAPGLPLDSFVALGGETASTSESILLVGGATVIGGGPTAQLGPDVIDIAWAPSVGIAVVDQTDYFVGRLTFTNDASGRLTYYGSTTDGGDVLIRSAILNGDPRADGDFNADGRVDNTDLGLLLNGWGSSSVPAEWVNTFTDPVNNDELNALINDWGSGFFTVPEPSAITLVVCFALHAAPRRTTL
ncbi:MAG: hypothetical protein AAFV43_07435 [Planctomycetota bacterium]